MRGWTSSPRVRPAQGNGCQPGASQVPPGKGPSRRAGNQAQPLLPLAGNSFGGLGVSEAKKVPWARSTPCAGGTRTTQTLKAVSHTTGTQPQWGQPARTAGERGATSTWGWGSAVEGRFQDGDGVWVVLEGLLQGQQRGLPKQKMLRERAVCIWGPAFKLLC